MTKSTTTGASAKKAAPTPPPATDALRTPEPSSVTGVPLDGRKARRTGLRDYRLLIFAYTTSSLGNWVYQLTLPLFVLKLTGSALATGAVYAVEYSPFLLFSLPGGVLADRLPRRTLVVVGDGVSGLLATGLAVLVTLHIHQVWPIFVVAFLLSSIDPIYHPAFQSFVPDVTPSHKLSQANSWMQTGDNAMGLVGPVIAGAAISLFGYETTIYLNAVTFFVSAAAILLLKLPAAAERVKQTARRLAGVRDDVRETMIHIFKVDRILMAGSLLFTSTNFAGWLIQANLIFYLTHYQHLSPSLIGVVYSAQGGGAVIGAAIAPHVLKRLASGQTLVLSTAAGGLLTLLLAVFRDVIGTAIVWGLVAGLGSISMVAWYTLRQRIVPRPLLGRVVAVTRMLAFASIPIAAIVAGVLENELHKVYAVILVAGLLRLGTALLAWRSPLRRRPVAIPPEMV